MIALLTLLACGTPEALEPAQEPPPPAATEAPAAPVGSIGGEPILPHPTVVGGISAAAINQALGPHQAALQGCHLAEKPGKVLVKFTINADGSVARTKTQSSTLRHPATEDCLARAVSQVAFPPLESGRVAVVHYPFDFP